MNNDIENIINEFVRGDKTYWKEIYNKSITYLNYEIEFYNENKLQNFFKTITTFEEVDDYPSFSTDILDRLKVINKK